MSLKKLLSLPLRRLSLAAAATVLLAGLSACGGGSRVEPFVPERLIALGDESSVLEAGGRKYSVNALQSDGVTPDCTTYPLWIQVLATNLGMAFSQCPGSFTTFAAETRAVPQAKVADVVGQLRTLGSANPGHKTVVTVLAGVNDVRELYESVAAGTRTLAQAVAEASARGAALGTEVGTLARLGPAVVVSTIPDVGRTPYAAARAAARADAPALLTQLSAELNEGLRLSIPQDGRLVALVFSTPVGYDINGNLIAGYVNDRACAVELPSCSTATLAEGVTTSNLNNRLWADDLRFGPATHAQLGARAVTRVRNNPF